MANIKKEKNRDAFIPTSSMSDIAFLLLLFFMVSTVFVQEKKFWVERERWPLAESIERVPRNHTTTIYVMRDETILIDDIPTRIESSEDVFVSTTLIRKKEEDPELVVCFRTDRETKYGVMSDVMRQLQDAQTLVVTFETQKRAD
ncbi:MAG: biopolymer transporter ExbD [Candidatus Cloacimonadaceae bacterium]|jgi:biopolymer transport protein ExbD|nr:biopolymer transporter ExbD [Candidatus Cloacimonadota bacterium]MDY0127610.1 biopolymer transporter ExbD [Candidatus Cloacimonadaceae bacterium]MCB5254941.1 biopolymer transporter ExbD [Candidatus Cloacimonadota bacterium]MCK9178041.1 biopolymer transporter ExbD [Candidatus Cloacimonadota bacterium]MCK9243176.1 biopolymer transporter ExbD [Candidatus Cloacimonadota bacterium]